MPVLVIDGPEKAGKSTLIGRIVELWQAQVSGLPAHIKHWGPVKSDTEYLHQLKHDMTLEPERLVIWDRSWASEHVYGLLLQRPRRLALDPWLGEWLYGRAADLKVVLHSHGDERATRRDSTDLPVNPYLEGGAFQEYAQRFGWQVLENDYTEGRLTHNASCLVSWLTNLVRYRGNPPVYCGSQDSPVVVVGEARNEHATFEGAWLPLTSALTIPLGRALGDAAMRVGWTNAHDALPAPLRSAKLLVALGDRADTFCRFHVGHNNVLKLPHPSWLFRYGRNRGLIEPTMDKFRSAVGKYMEVTL